jgi:hypothetical protein
MMFNQKTLNGFSMLNRMASLETPASHAGCRAFVSVVPPRPDKEIPRVEPPFGIKEFEKWRVTRFEIPEQLVDGWFAQEQLINFQSIFVNTIEEVEALLAEWGLDSARFDAPWKNDWPL